MNAHSFGRRFIELERHDPAVEKDAYRSDYMMCVYKSADKAKRLNAVIVRRISEVHLLYPGS